jgi:plastocyanin
LFLALGALALVGCGGGEDSSSGSAASAPAPAAPAADPSQSGTLAGTISLDNGPDPDTAIKMDADPVCAGLHNEAVHSSTRVTDDAGNLANALVYIKSGLEGQSFSPPAEVAMINQEGCIYKPHVGAVMVGQTVKVVNSDPTLHNVHATPSNNPEFNQAQPFQGMELERTFETAEIPIPFKCDVHPWMQSYLAVLDNPFFAVSGADGSFSIPGIPAGSYTVEVWHETLGTKTADVSIDAGGSAELNLAFGAGG